ncbi:MAG: cytochrome c family protein [bacterium]
MGGRGTASPLRGKISPFGRNDKRSVEMTRMNKIIFLILLLFLVIKFTFADQATYEGGKRCRTCHMKQNAGMIYEKWEASQHARAFDDLSEDERKNPFCLKCHVTGYSEPSSSGIKFNDLLGIQCEACHGPGGLYKKLEIMNEEEYKRDFFLQRKKAIEVGMIIPTEETCKKCHNKESPHYKPFVFRVAYPKIKHLIPRRYLYDYTD